MKAGRTVFTVYLVIVPMYNYKLYGRIAIRLLMKLAQD